jgi:hypothetical protein
MQNASKSIEIRGYACKSTAVVTHLALLQHGKPLVARLLEERRADLAAVAVQQVDAEQSALALGIRPAADVGLGGDTRLNRPPERDQCRITTGNIRQFTESEFLPAGVWVDGVDGHDGTTSVVIAHHRAVVRRGPAVGTWRRFRGAVATRRCRSGCAIRLGYRWGLLVGRGGRGRCAIGTV